MDRLDMDRAVSDEEIRAAIRGEIGTLSRKERLSVNDRLRLEHDVFNSLRRLDILSDLLEDDDVTEIMINGPSDIFIEKGGRLSRLDRKFSSADKLSDIIQTIVARNNQMVNESSPIVDTRLPDGSRVSIVLPPVSVDRPTVTIRRFPKDPYSMDRLVANGTMSPEVADFLKTLVVARYNIFISGGTGSGKTTLLNALTGYIPNDERVITIEDSAELKVIGIPNLVRLEARAATLEGKLAVTIRDLVRASLRMRPDRIIVGECRGGETLEMLQACDTGHDGSLSTGHANSTRDMLARLETMTLMGMDLPVSAIRRQIAGGIDFFVHVSRMRDRSRKLIAIDEVDGMKDGEVQLSPIYRYEVKGGSGAWVKKNPVKHTDKLALAGLLPAEGEPPEVLLPAEGEPPEVLLPVEGEPPEVLSPSDGQPSGS